MPIYAYKCDSCGFAKDVLQKLSDAPLSDCPKCGATAFKKQLTAAGFQLKGSGWYATDFKGGGGATPPADDKGSEGGDAKPEAKPDSAGAEATKPDATPVKKADAPPPAAGT
jgi:putative FmdB family regulatory protein